MFTVCSLTGQEKNIILEEKKKGAFVMGQKPKQKQIQNQKSNAFSIVSLILGLVGVVIATLYLVYRFLSDRAYHRKWKDYDDCGLA